MTWAMYLNPCVRTFELMERNRPFIPVLVSPGSKILSIRFKLNIFSSLSTVAMLLPSMTFASAFGSSVVVDVDVPENGPINNYLR